MKQISGKALGNILISSGWEAVSSKGSHFKYKKLGGATIIVPHHGNKPLGKGLLVRILKQANLTEADL